MLATDWSAEAVSATRANAERNRVRLEAIECAWTDPKPILERAPWDLVLASDVLYERRNVALLLDLLGRLVDERGLVLVADPGRAAAADFAERAEADGWSVLTRESPRSKRVVIYRMRMA